MKLSRELKKYSQFCAYCGHPFFYYEQKTIDHLKPKSKGGKGALSNIVCACAPCNNEKADSDLKDWLKPKFRRIKLKAYLKAMRGFKKHYSELIFKKIREAI